VLLIQQPGAAELNLVNPEDGDGGRGNDRTNRFILRAFRMRTGGLPCVKRDCAVICIRYEDFSAGTHDGAGLHGRAERGPRGVTVYLIPGLTACQRRAVFRRLRQEASRYVGPELPLPQLVVALGLDRLRSAAAIAGAIVRLHPAVTLLPGALVAALLSLFVIASAGGPPLTTGQRPGLADAVAAGAGVQTVTEAVVPARAGGITSAVGARVSGPAKRAPGKRAMRGIRMVSLARSSDTWYACPPVADGPEVTPLPGQPACGRSVSLLAPYTAQLPEPRAFAT
jgi:hypothetical protein